MIDKILRCFILYSNFILNFDFARCSSPSFLGFAPHVQVTSLSKFTIVVLDWIRY